MADVAGKAGPSGSSSVDGDVDGDSAGGERAGPQGEGPDATSDACDASSGTRRSCGTYRRIHNCVSVLVHEVNRRVVPVILMMVAMLGATK